MFLALKEMKHDRLRYSMIIAIIALISYVMFVITALALGLAGQNTAAINSWNAKSITLSDNADNQLRGSLLTTEQVNDSLVDGSSAALGYAATKVKVNDTDAGSVTFIGLDPTSYLAHDIPIAKGTTVSEPGQVVIDDGYAHAHDISPGTTVRMADTEFHVVGIVHNAKMSVGPVIYGDLTDWGKVRPLPAGYSASAVVHSEATSPVPAAETATISIDEFINALPGYSAQNSTFTFMIVVLALVATIVIGVFLYILVLQKIPMIALLKAQGVPSRFLVRSTVLQSIAMVSFGVIIGGAGLAATALAVPSTTFMEFNLPLSLALAGGMVLMAVIAALIPARTIRRVDPVTLMA